MTDDLGVQCHVFVSPDRYVDGQSTTILLSDAIGVVVESNSREEIDREICRQLAAIPSWQFVWIGESHATGDRLSCRASAGDTGSYLADVTVEVTDDPAAEPAGRASATRSTQVVDDVDVEQPDGNWARRVRESGCRSAVSVPLVYEGVPYGVLTVYSTRAAAFGQAERGVLETIGHAVALACNAMDRRTALVSDRATELDIRVPADAAFVTLATRLDAPVSIDRFVPQEGDELRVYFSVSQTTTEPGEPVETADAITSPSLVAKRNGDLVYDGTVSEDGLLATMLDHAAVPNCLSPCETGGHLTVRLPASTDVASFGQMLQSRHPEAELVARRTVDRTRESERDVCSNVKGALTDRQRDALEMAYLSGYFEWPREQSGQQVGSRLDISQPTFNRHLRDGLRKVMTTVFDENGADKSEE